jgi:RNA polymerase sigma-70 factor (ECF subfamily)
LISNRPSSTLGGDAGAHIVPEPAVGNERARSLVDAHIDFVARLARNLGVGDADVDDLVQQAFSVTAARLATIPPDKERSFLIEVTARLAANYRRRRATAREIATDKLPEVVDRAPSPEELFDRQRARMLIDRILDSMDLDLRAVFVLYEIEEMQMTEIATVLRIPPGTVASRLRRARRRFERGLRRLGLGGLPGKERGT